MKKTLLIMLLVLVIDVMAASKTETFSFNYKIKTYDNVVNISIDDSSYTSYNCSINNADIITKNIDRTVNYDCPTCIDQNNITSGLSALTSTCNSIAIAYQDISSYYKPYVECKASLSSCDTSLAYIKTDADAKVKTESDLKAQTTEYESVKKKNSELEISSAACAISDMKLQKDDKWWFGAIGAIIGAVLSWWWFVKRIQVTTDIDKETMPKITSGGGIRTRSDYPQYVAPSQEPNMIDNSQLKETIRLNR